MWLASVQIASPLEVILLSYAMQWIPASRQKAQSRACMRPIARSMTLPSFGAGKPRSVLMNALLDFCRIPITLLVNTCCPLGPQLHVAGQTSLIPIFRANATPTVARRDCRVPGPRPNQLPTAKGRRATNHRISADGPRPSGSCLSRSSADAAGLRTRARWKRQPSRRLSRSTTDCDFAAKLTELLSLPRALGGHSRRSCTGAGGGARRRHECHLPIAQFGLGPGRRGGVRSPRGCRTRGREGGNGLNGGCPTSGAVVPLNNRNAN